MQFVSTIGSVRRSQGIFTFGTGAIVDFPSGSFMPLGLQHMEWQWSGLPPEAKAGITFYEPRLARMLGIREFRCYPVPGEGQLSNYGKRVAKDWGTPCARFPRWLECPKCNRLGTTGEPFEEQPDGIVQCLGCAKPVNPVRFVVACEQGHIDDFPWVEWAHSEVKEVCSRPLLTLRSGGRSAALSDLYVACQCGNGRSLGDIFRPGEMKRFRCRGERPWLRMNEKCGRDVLTLQRGGSNVHFTVSASMLSIPPASESIAKLLEPEWSWLSVLPDAALAATMEGFLKNKDYGLDPNVAADWVRRRRGIDTDPGALDEGSARHQEYESLSRTCERQPHDTEAPDFENTVFRPQGDVLPWVDLVGAVHRLREVRANCGFTRIEPVVLAIEQIPQALIDRRVSPLSAAAMNWRPAVEVRGEGIFLRLNEARVIAWSAEERVQVRAASINMLFAEKCRRDGFDPPYVVTPRLLLVHSLAHVLLRRMSLDCGYSTASLRERLYAAEPAGSAAMAGVLIYTASSDSDGSLGGLVNLATPERVSHMIRRAIGDARWCGSDPVCIETEPRTQGERVSGAACHNCLLAPETACERFNRELDRSLLVGYQAATAGESIPGFFEDLATDD